MSSPPHRASQQAVQPAGQLQCRLIVRKALDGNALGNRYQQPIYSAAIRTANECAVKSSSQRAVVGPFATADAFILCSYTRWIGKPVLCAHVCFCVSVGFDFGGGLRMWGTCSFPLAAARALAPAPAGTVMAWFAASVPLMSLYPLDPPSRVFPLPF